MDSNIRYVAANNETIEHDGFTILSIEIGKWKTKQKAIVIKKLSTDLLLGTDWLKQNGVILNYHKSMFTCGKFFSPLLTTKTQITHSIHTNQSITIAACSSHVELISVPDSFNGKAYLENENPIRYLNVRDGLFTITKNQVPIILINKNNFEVLVGKRKFIGTIEKIDDVKISNVKCSPTPHDPNLSRILNCDKRLTTVQKHDTQQLAVQYNQIFSKNNNDLGYYTKTEFDIQTGDHRPIKCRPYRVHYAHQDTVNKMIDDMLTHRIFSKSNSPWATPVVIVKKKDASNRFCLDYRKLNNITIKDNYPIPLIEETLDTLKGAKFFTSLDLASGYWQIGFSGLAKQKTALISQKGLFQFGVLPLGLSNAVSAFQRTMEVVLEGVPNVKVYLDDILIFSENFEDHIHHIKTVFQKLLEANLKIKPSKCSFAKREPKFLGFDITSEGIEPCREKLQAMINNPVPKNQKQVKRFLGMASYYRKFIPQLSTKADPIKKLLRKNSDFLWSIECDTGFKKIIDALVNPPVLIYPDFTKSFILETDASIVGLGAVLAQKDKHGVNTKFK